MPLESGSFTATFFEMPEKPGDATVSAFAARAAGLLDAVPAEEPQIGWVSGRHLLETAIDEGNAWCGSVLHLAMRTARRKLPASLLNAICRRAELEYMSANQTDFVPRAKRREIKAEMTEKWLPKMPPSLSAVPFAWDPASGMLVSAGTPGAQQDEFIALFYRTTGLEPAPWTPESMCRKITGGEYSELPEFRCGDASGAEITPGRDFLTWLWFFSETGTEKIKHPDFGEFELLVEAPFVLAGSSDASGAAEISVKKGDCPGRSAETKAALSVGKKLKKARISLARGNQIFSCGVDADRFSFGSLKLPEGEAADAVSQFEDRIFNCVIFKAAVEAFFRRFLEELSGDPDGLEKRVAAWIADRDSL